jgi:hypothetical protein
MTYEAESLPGFEGAMPKKLGLGIASFFCLRVILIKIIA